MLVKFSIIHQMAYFVIAIAAVITLLFHTLQANSDNQVLQKPRITSCVIESNVNCRYAETVISSKVINPANISQEFNFTAMIPNDKSYITDFIVSKSNEIYKSVVMEKEEAETTYNETKHHRRPRTAGNLQMTITDWTVLINVEPLEEVTFNLTYGEYLYCDAGPNSACKHIINIHPGQVVNDLNVVINVQESSNITTLEVQKYLTTTKNGSKNDADNSLLATIVKPTDNTTEINWKPSADDQKRVSADGVHGQLVIRYDVDRDKESRDILLEDGRFVHFQTASDQCKAAHFIFILDVGKTISGVNLRQMKNTTNILSAFANRSSLITFSDEAKVIHFDKRKGRVDDYIQNIPNTNIATTANSAAMIEALKNGIDLAKSGTKCKWTTYPAILLFTDGMLTGVGDKKSSENKITKIITELNKEIKCPMFSFALGYEPNFEFLKKLSLSNFGFAVRVYNEVDAEIMFDKFPYFITSLIGTDVSYRYLPERLNQRSIARSKFFEATAAGKPDESKNRIGNVERMYAYKYTRSLWEDDKNKSLELALRYSFVTPLASLVINGTDVFDITDSRSGVTSTTPTLKSTPKTEPTTDNQKYFTCGNGSRIFDSFKCDGTIDCSDGADEANCVPSTTPTLKSTPKTEPTTDNQKYFTCGNGSRIFDSFKCDGTFDCSDGADEANCVTSTTPTLKSTPKTEPTTDNQKYFTCGNGSRIFDSFKCDGTYDCSDGTDEANCPNN